MTERRKSSAGWKMNVDDKACYIDVEAEEQNDSEEAEADDLNPENRFRRTTSTDDELANGSGQSPWCDLPDHIMERIFAHLSIRERYYASLVLVVSPQNIDDDVLTLLADSRVRHLYLFQNRYTPAAIAISPCSVRGWRLLRRDNPNLRVHLRAESTSGAAEILLQPEPAPVHSMIYQSPRTMITSDKLLAAVDVYKYTLAVYGHEMLPDFTSPVEFQDRVDSLLVLMARSCPELAVLMIRERISTATLLIIARTAQNLHHLYVRRSQLVEECDWPKNPDWTDEYYQWLRVSSASVEATEREISQILEVENWRALSDEHYKMTSLTKHVEH